MRPSEEYRQKRENRDTFLDSVVHALLVLTALGVLAAFVLAFTATLLSTNGMPYTALDIANTILFSSAVPFAIGLVMLLSGLGFSPECWDSHRKYQRLLSEEAERELAPSERPARTDG